ncbi:MAG: hypothetical protein JW797_00655 [Bradymonadales bacterium]|nr:hypothetical protein [Bradymonadales bacterium]
MSRKVRQKRVGLALLLCACNAWFFSTDCRPRESPQAIPRPDQPLESPSSGTPLAAEPTVAEPLAPGTILTMLTRIGYNAPAAVLDVVGSVRVRLLWGEEGQESESLLLPIGGIGILVSSQAAGPGVIDLELVSPQLEVVATNRLSIAEFSSGVGVLSLEIAPRPETRGCLRCSDPEQLIDLPRLHETAVFYSGYLQPAEGRGERLLVAMRASIPVEQRDEVLRMSGGVVEEHSDAGGDGLIWARLVPTEEANLVDMALFLGRCPEVCGIELWGEGRSGRFWVPWW